MPRAKPVELGDQVIDAVTGFSGIALARTTWLHGCDRITIQPRVDRKGEVPGMEVFDEPQIKVTKRAVVKSQGIDTGGPIPTPTQKGLADTK